MNTNLRASMEELVLRAHHGQTRNAGRLPYAVHVLSVGKILDEAARQAGEIADAADLDALYLAGLGHDLYEDTKVTPDEVRETLGELGRRVDGLIAGMTNARGDDDRNEYVAHMRDAEEEVRLIKLADLIDNATSCAYGIHDLGVPFIENTLKPIFDEMAKALEVTTFPRLPKTADLLQGWLGFAQARLRSNLEIAKTTLPQMG